MYKTAGTTASDQWRRASPRMKQFLSTLPRNLLDCFRGRMIIWHVIAIILTFILVTSGLDWLYFTSTRNPILRSWMFPAAPIGGLVPIALPLMLLAIGSIGRGAKTTLAGWAVGQAELVGALVAAAYKAFTGRAHPAHGVGADISHIFQFGFLRGGVFWGWPSSHTTIAFAMAVTLFQLFPKQRWLGYVAITYALYIGIGISMTIHWFSDFLAGAIIGTAIGAVVGKTFLRSQTCPVEALQVGE
jgi:membrane-associated phospholipid phosphatase